MKTTNTLSAKNKIIIQLRYYLPTFIVFITVLVACEVLINIFDVKEFILPKPTVIGSTFISHFKELINVGWFTLKEALGGFVIGCSLGIIVALIGARWTITNEILLPFAIAANSVPIIAFAPIMNNWFGVTNPFSKMMIVSIIVFFPMMINTIRGLTLVDSKTLELMHSYAASDFEILYKVRIPNALPYMFNAFKIASTLSLIGAVVGEFFGGPRASLGIYITQEAAGFRFANAWAAIIIACILGISFYLIILLLERLVMPWHVSIRGKQ